MSGSKIMGLADAKAVLQMILNNPMEIRCKTVVQMEALNLGAKMVERACANGANLHHELAILQYHAANKEAILFREERILGAIKEAIEQINLCIIRNGGGADE